jgi:hypothetical protein
LKDLQGSAFITGILFSLVMFSLWSMVWLIFDHSLMPVILACWTVAAVVPFVARVVNLWLLHEGHTSQGR